MGTHSVRFERRSCAARAFSKMVMSSVERTGAGRGRGRGAVVVVAAGRRSSSSREVAGEASWLARPKQNANRERSFMV
jgi:hypothetical protein